MYERHRGQVDGEQIAGPWKLEGVEPQAGPGNCGIVCELIKMLMQLNLEPYVHFRGKIYLDTNFPHKSLMIHL